MARRPVIPRRLRAARSRAADRKVPSGVLRPAPERREPTASTLVAIVAVLVLLGTVVWVVAHGGSTKKHAASASSTTPTASRDGTDTASDSASPQTSSPQSSAQPALPVPGPDAVRGVVASGGVVDVYRSASYSADVVMRLDAGTTVTLVCTVDGPTAYYRGQATDTWGLVLTADPAGGKSGYIPAAYLDTGGDPAAQTHNCP